MYVDIIIQITLETDKVNYVLIVLTCIQVTMILEGIVLLDDSF